MSMAVTVSAVTAFFLVCFQASGSRRKLLVVFPCARAWGLGENDTPSQVHFARLTRLRGGYAGRVHGRPPVRIAPETLVSHSRSIWILALELRRLHGQPGMGEARPFPNG